MDNVQYCSEPLHTALHCTYCTLHYTTIQARTILSHDGCFYQRSQCRRCSSSQSCLRNALVLIFIYQSYTDKVYGPFKFFKLDKIISFFRQRKFFFLLRINYNFRFRIFGVNNKQNSWWEIKTGHNRDASKKSRGGCILLWLFKK